MTDLTNDDKPVASTSTTIIPMPGVAIPLSRAATFDPEVARIAEELQEGHLVLNAGPVDYRAMTAEEERKLNEALDAVFAPAP